LLVASVVCLAVFGLLLGSFTGGTQLWAAPLKVSAGTFAAMLICLPSLYIFSALSGVNACLSQIFGVLMAAVTLTSLLLLGFAPVLWVFSQSSESLPFMGFLALAFWLIALVFGLRMLLAVSSIHMAQSLGYIKTWLAIFVVVTLQMSTALRPIIGKADTLLPTEKRFFIQHWMEEMELGDGVKRGRR
ncbi:MAG: ABC-type transport system, permease component, partial [Verrucomicrobiaceae bacterium]|nr:ABC-type transport system, permease component [Verrucomicrobiaceae bacterium]